MQSSKKYYESSLNLSVISLKFNQSDSIIKLCQCWPSKDVDIISNNLNHVQTFTLGAD